MYPAEVSFIVVYRKLNAASDVNGAGFVDRCGWPVPVKS
jgi:hypothetical protein